MPSRASRGSRPRGSTSAPWWAFVLLLAACGHPGGDLAPGSYERGVAELEDGYELEAIEDLKLFIRRNPTDDRADDAQFQVAQAHMEMKDYPVAAVEFEILRADYPNSELVESAFYNEGVCYLRQVPGIELEQSSAVKAVAHLQRYLREFPQGEHREEVERELARMQKHLDEKELTAARLYLRLGRAEAARVTALAALEEHPGSPLEPELLMVAAQASTRLDEPGEARVYLERLLQDHPDHPLARTARRRLEAPRPRLDEEDEGGR